MRPPARIDLFVSPSPFLLSPIRADVRLCRSSSRLLVDGRVPSFVEASVPKPPSRWDVSNFFIPSSPPRFPVSIVPIPSSNEEIRLADDAFGKISHMVSDGSWMVRVQAAKTLVRRHVGILQI